MIHYSGKKALYRVKCFCESEIIILPIIIQNHCTIIHLILEVNFFILNLGVWGCYTGSLHEYTTGTPLYDL